MGSSNLNLNFSIPGWVGAAVTSPPRQKRHRRARGGRTITPASGGTNRWLPVSGQEKATAHFYFFDSSNFDLHYRCRVRGQGESSPLSPSSPPSITWTLSHRSSQLYSIWALFWLYQPQTHLTSLHRSPVNQKLTADQRKHVNIQPRLRVTLYRTQTKICCSILSINVLLKLDMIQF